jgi:hypothetical protein
MPLMGVRREHYTLDPNFRSNAPLYSEKEGASGEMGLKLVTGNPLVDLACQGIELHGNNAVWLDGDQRHCTF